MCSALETEKIARRFDIQLLHDAVFDQDGIAPAVVKQRLNCP